MMSCQILRRRRRWCPAQPTACVGKCLYALKIVGVEIFADPASLVPRMLVCASTEGFIAPA